jgi:5-methylcytosine-specific restriction endonuclease McrA
MCSDTTTPGEAPKTDKRAYQAEYYRKHRAAVLERTRLNYLAHREERSVTTKAWRENNPEKVKGYSKKHALTHHDENLAASRRWYQRNAEAQRQRSRIKRVKAYQENRESILKRNREWAHKHPESVLWRSQKRRALKKAASVNLNQIREWIDSIKSKRFAICYYCDKRISTKAIHIDHIVALAKGGAHSVDNLCVSCAPCNLSKQAKHVTAWVRIGQQVLAL